MKTSILSLASAVLAALALLGFGAGGSALAQNSIESVNVSPQPGGKVVPRGVAQGLDDVVVEGAHGSLLRGSPRRRRFARLEASLGATACFTE